MALSRPQERPQELEPESAGPSMFSPKSVTNKVLSPPKAAISRADVLHPHLKAEAI